MALDPQRRAVNELSFNNLAYKNAEVSFYTVDPATGAKTSTLATLYAAPSGSATLTNPQTLDTTGKLVQPVYHDEPVIGSISSGLITAHDTGIMFNGYTYRGVWESGVVYFPNDIMQDGANGDDTKDLVIATEIHTSDVYTTDLSGGSLEVFMDISILQAVFSLPVSIANGGTGQTTAGAALTAFGFSTYIKTLIGAADAAAALSTLTALGQGKHAINFPAGMWRPQTTNGCGLLQTEESTTNDVMTDFRAFANGSTTYAQVWFRAPKSSDESASFSGRIAWKEASGATTHVCRWAVEAQAQGDSDALDSAWGTAVAVDDTGTSGTRREIAFTGLTPAGTWAEGDWIGIRLSRLGGHANDTLDVAAHFIGLQLDLTVNAATDA